MFLKFVIQHIYKDDNESTKNMYVGEVIKSQFGPAIGAHAGPGAVGVAFIGDAPE